MAGLDAAGGDGGRAAGDPGADAQAGRRLSHELTESRTRVRLFFARNMTGRPGPRRRCG
ncbi:hypothetical protein EMIT048CA2_40405 [Pseudomonas chlororaphis]